MKKNMMQGVIEVQARELDGGKQILSVGAKASLQDVYECQECPQIMREALRRWVVWQKRVEYTVDRVVLSPDLAPQWIATLLAFGAHVVFNENNHESSLADFIQRADQMRGKLAAIVLPINVPGRVWGEAHVSRTPIDEPIISANAIVDIDDGVVRQARLALTGAWREHAHLAQAAQILVGAPLLEGRFEELVKALEHEVEPPNDHRGSAEYRRVMVGVTTRRALNACIKGAQLQ